MLIQYFYADILHGIVAGRRPGSSTDSCWEPGPAKIPPGSCYMPFVNSFVHSRGDALCRPFGHRLSVVTSSREDDWRRFWPQVNAVDSSL